MMSKLMKQWVLFGLLILVGGLLLAQLPGESFGRHRPGSPSGPVPSEGLQQGPEQSGAPIRLIKRFLELTEDQTQAIIAILDENRQSAKVLLDQIRELERALKEELDSGAPDAATVGNIAIQLHDLKNSLGENRKAAAEAILALLSPEQLRKVEAVRRAASLQKVVEAFRQLGILGPVPPPPGPGNPPPPQP